MRFDKILIDCSNLYHRAYNTGRDLTTRLEDGTEIITGGIYNSIRMIRSIENKYLSDTGEVYLLFDNSTSKENIRKYMDPEYKSNRAGHEDRNFYRGIDIFHLLMLSYKDNYVIVQKPGCEADDLVAPLLSEFESDSKVLLISNDMDWARSISENVYWGPYSQQLKGYVLYDAEAFIEKYGFDARNNGVTLFKAFRGDSVDNIPKGVPGIRKEVLYRIIDEYGTLNEFFNAMEDLDYIGDIWKKKIREGKSRIRLNYKLADFLPIQFKDVEPFIVYSEFRPNSLRFQYLSLGFDISTVDDRLVGLFPESSERRGFFKFKKMKRV